mgnify:CR=1 FL=1
MTQKNTRVVKKLLKNKLKLFKFKLKCNLNMGTVQRAKHINASVQIEQGYFDNIVSHNDSWTIILTWRDEDCLKSTIYVKYWMKV